LSNLSSASEDLISKIFVKDDKKRIKLEKILDHDFFKPSYPELMPSSTLTCPPSLSYEMNFLKNGNKMRDISQPQTAQIDSLAIFEKLRNQNNDETNEFEEDNGSFASNIKLIRARSTSVFNSKNHVFFSSN
jgi:serine/threonine protein kinase